MAFNVEEMGNIKVIHLDDGKGKWQSYEIYLDNEKGYLSSDIFDITGYGESKEKALEEFKRYLEQFTESINNLNRKVKGKTVEELEEK